MIDSVLMSLIVLAFILNKNMWPAMVAYLLCIVYQNVNYGGVYLFDYHSAVVNHVIYGVIFITLSIPATIKLWKLSLSMTAYSIFHLFIAVDYFIFPTYETYKIEHYNFVQISLILCLIISGYKRAKNGGADSYQSLSDLHFNNFNSIYSQTYKAADKGGSRTCLSS